MDELIIRALKGEATEHEMRQMERWRQTSPDHEAEFHELRQLWEGEVELRPGTVPSPPPLSDILQEGNRRRDARVTGRVGPRLFRSPFLGIGLSAAAAVALFFILRGPGYPGAGPERLTPLDTSSSAANVTTMGLSDGSVVRLASGSRLEFPPDSLERRVVMTGKAFFAVAPGPHPFVVDTEVGSVRVRGTRFEVETAGTEMRVVVLEGMVAVEGFGNRMLAGPGQAAFLSSDGQGRVEADADLTTLLDWPGGLLIFQETPFAEVAREVAEHFDVTFDVPPGEMSRRRVTAWFEDEPVEAVVRGVCMVVGAQCRVDHGRVLVR